jgi:hypothetical protein
MSTLREEAKKDFYFYSLNFRSFPANEGEKERNFEDYFKEVWKPAHDYLIKGCLL